MKIVVIALGAVLLLLATVVFSTLVLRIVKGGPPAQGPAAGQPVPALPAGARILATSLGDGRLAVVYEAQGRQGVLLYDAATLAPVGRIEAAPP
jgi:hypothetical protein